MEAETLLPVVAPLRHVVSESRCARCSCVASDELLRRTPVSGNAVDRLWWQLHVVAVRSSGQ